jgi:hypothetical protein
LMLVHRSFDKLILSATSVSFLCTTVRL